MIVKLKRNQIITTVSISVALTIIIIVGYIYYVPDSVEPVYTMLNEKLETREEYVYGKIKHWNEFVFGRVPSWKDFVFFWR